MKSGSYPFISVIIPVLDDPLRLDTCLKALAYQNYPKDSYEIIVIDNGSQESVFLTVNKYSLARLVHEFKPGSYAARNTGLTIAKGPLIAFTDADCIPDGDWLKKGVRHFVNTPHCGLLAGKIDIFFDNPNKLSLAELYEKYISFDQKFYLDEKRFGATANLFTSLEVFDRAGPFNASLKSGGDAVWGEKVFECGYTQIFKPDVCVNHPARKSLFSLIKKYQRLTGGVVEIEKTRRHPIIASLYGIRDDLNLIYFYKSLRRKKIPESRLLLVKLLLVRGCIAMAKIAERLYLFLGGTSKRK